jgi:pyruvate/2-oxoglutarate dehydrogenase complex dihydrolipoamide acyltransferase (E2) component
MDTYQVMPLPLERRLVLDAGWINRNKTVMSGFVEVDVTKARRLLREQRVNSGQRISFTAFLLACLGQALENNKSLHAYRDWRNQLILYEEVDAALMIEIDIDERKFPLMHVVRAINKRSLNDIHDEIRSIQQEPTYSTNFNQGLRRLMDLFLRMPGFLRHILYRIVLLRPHWFRAVAGTVAVSSVGMYLEGGGWGLGLPNHTLSLTVGGISEKPGVVDGGIEIREYLNLTISFDHVVVDGAPAARFTKEFMQLIEDGFGLAEEL